MAALNGIDLRIANLGGTSLGMASGNTIWLDDNAAGWGWFVDATPWSDSEFLLPSSPLTLASCKGRGNVGNRMDLRTVVMHELGHLLGHNHDADGVMAETLAAGVRRTGLELDHVALTDQVIGQGSDYLDDAWLGMWLNEGPMPSARGIARESARFQSLRG